MAAMGEKSFSTSNDASADLPGREASQPKPPASAAPSGLSSGSTMPTDHFTKTTGDDNLLNRVVQGAHHTIDRLAETAAPHMQRLQEGVGTRAEHAKEVGDQWAESLRGSVRENPLVAVATALAVGVLIARLTQR
jgi:ElaB/YqjD/DUF883 family membrane-anchored ribosome-binding protein